MQYNLTGPAEPNVAAWKVTTLDGRTYTLPYWQYLNGCAAAPFGSTIVLQPGQTLTATLPTQGCAPAFNGWWTTVNVGTPPDADSGPTGVREPVNR